MTRENERKIITNENMCGGKGHVIIEKLLNDEQLSGKCKMYAKVTIEKDCSLGYHVHRGESETYFILSGYGEYDDNGTKMAAKPGDVFFCEDGNGHALSNSGNESVVFMALIIYK